MTTTLAQPEFSGMRIGALVERFDALGYNAESPITAYDAQVMLDAAWNIKNDLPDKALEALDDLNLEAMGPHSSFAMRVYYLMGIAHMARAFLLEGKSSTPRYALAATKFKRAGAIAEFWSDARSQAVITRMIGETQHCRLDYKSSIDEFLSALAVLDRYELNTLREAPGRILLHTLLARQHFITGNLRAARKHQAIARGTAQAIGGKAMSEHSRYSIEWTSALILRAISRLRGGDYHMLDQALNLLDTSRKRLNALKSTPEGAEPFVVYGYPRALIQLGETHLDMAQWYRAQSSARSNSYKNHLAKAQVYLIDANQALLGTNDDAASRLLQLALWRHDLLSGKASDLIPVGSPDPQGLRASQALAPHLQTMVTFAGKIDDIVLRGHTRTLHGELLLASGDAHGGLAILYKAITDYHEASAAGEATRARFAILDALGLV